MARGDKSLGLGKGLLVSGIATLVTLVVLELFVRAFVPVRHVGPPFSIHDATLGKRLRPNFEATRITPEFEFVLRTNSLGMRGPEPQRPLDNSVVFLGDSFTLGYGVAGHETFPALIHRRLQERGVSAPVLNMGIGNAGNGRWLKLLDSEVGQYDPQLIVLQFMANDFSDNLREGFYRLDSAGRLQRVPVPPPGLGRRLRAVVDVVPGLAYSYLVGLAWTASGGQGLRFSPRPPADPSFEHERDALTYALVEAAFERARRLGAEVLLLSVGTRGARRAKLARLAESAGVPYFDAPTKSSAPELYYEVDGHWNARGHRAVADLLMPSVLDAVTRR